MKKILFIVPPNITFKDFVCPPVNVKSSSNKDGSAYGAVITDVPLGVLSLSSYVKKNISIEAVLVDFNVELNKLNNFKYNEFADYFSSVLSDKTIRGFGPDVIGISAQFAPAFQNLIDIVEVCRNIFGDVLIVAGGNLPSTSYKDILKSTHEIDAICYGEGEIPFLELLKSDDLKEHIKESPSWIMHEKLERNVCFEYDFIDHLDDVPFLDYDLIDISGYDINPTMGYYTEGASRGRGIAVMTSRGCPFKCIFCASHKVHGRDMRYHSVDRVIEDAKKLQDRFDANTIVVFDDHFMGDKKRAFEIVERLSQLGLKLFFPSALALYALDRTFLELLKRSGVNQLILSVESGSERVLKSVMKKPLKLEIVKRVANDCRDIGIYTDCNILIGLPGETKSDIKDTLEFLKTIDADWFRINVATPLAGSEMYDICEDKNYFKEKPLLGNFKKAIVETPEFTSEYIQETSYMMNIELNFVNNSNMRFERYSSALDGFRSVLRAKYDHPLAHYYSGVCLKMLGDMTGAKDAFRMAKKYSLENEFWMKIINKFNILIDV